MDMGRGLAGWASVVCKSQRWGACLAQVCTFSGSFVGESSICTKDMFTATIASLQSISKRVWFKVFTKQFIWSIRAGSSSSALDEYNLWLSRYLYYPMEYVQIQGSAEERRGTAISRRWLSHPPSLLHHRWPWIGYWIVKESLCVGRRGKWFWELAASHLYLSWHYGSIRWHFRCSSTYSSTQMQAHSKSKIQSAYNCTMCMHLLVSLEWWIQVQLYYKYSTSSYS